VVNFHCFCVDAGFEGVCWIGQRWKFVSHNFFKVREKPRRFPGRFKLEYTWTDPPRDEKQNWLSELMQALVEISSLFVKASGLIGNWSINYTQFSRSLLADLILLFVIGACWWPF